MSPALSAYLDLLRFVAAAAVLFSHMGQDGFDMSWMPLTGMGHEAVVVFFVMSGYIIYGSAASGRGDWVDYAVARASRIYSVAVPAIVFCLLLSAMLAWLSPPWLGQVASLRPFRMTDVLGSLLFLNESWLSPTQLTLNGPYWSLCYEVWYYVAFGVWYYVRAWWRWPLFVLVSLVASPAIMLLFPIWCMGAWAARHRGDLPRWPAALAWLVFLGSLALVVVIDRSDIDNVIKVYLHNHVPGFWRLAASQRVVTDYLVGVLIVANILAFPALPDRVAAVFVRWRKPLSVLAGFSFTLYLFHRPLTQTAGPALANVFPGVGLALVATAGVLLICWLISRVTERRLPAWRRACYRLAGRPPQRPATGGSAVRPAG